MVDEILKSLVPTLLSSLQAAGVFGGVLMGALYALARRDLREAQKEIKKIQAERIAEGKKALEVYEAATAERTRRREADEGSAALFAQMFRLLSMPDDRSTVLREQATRCWPQNMLMPQSPEPRP